MSISSSVITLNLLQPDGSRIVHETHTDHLGVPHEMRYVAGTGVDVDAVMASHVAGIEAALAQAEAEGLLA